MWEWFKNTKGISDNVRQQLVEEILHCKSKGILSHYVTFDIANIYPINKKNHLIHETMKIILN